MLVNNNFMRYLDFNCFKGSLALVEIQKGLFNFLTYFFEIIRFKKFVLDSGKIMMNYINISLLIQISKCIEYFELIGFTVHTRNSVLHNVR